jgi:hypothetical protein
VFIIFADVVLIVPDKLIAGRASPLKGPTP